MSDDAIRILNDIEAKFRLLRRALETARGQPAIVGIDPVVSNPPEYEMHYTCHELSEKWGLGESTIRKMFRDEPGVLHLAHIRRRGKRDYVSIRIPGSVAARVYARVGRSLGARQN